MATEASNKIKYLLATKAIDFSADAFKIILMATGFTFDKDTHHTYADVLASEHVNGTTGYTTGGSTLLNVVVTEDDTVDKCTVAWDDVQWTAAGTGIVSPGAIIFDDTVASPADPVVCFIDFGGDKTILAGGVLAVANPGVDIA